MLAKVLSCAVIGLDGEIIEVEVDVSRAQNPTTAIVGLPDAAVQESKERVRSAVKNSTLTWPFNSRIVINLAPADLKKEGPAYDLPIAVGVLIASGQVEAELDDAVFVGEMALNGDVRSVRGVLPMVAIARQQGMKRAFVPQANAQEAALVEGIDIFPVANLTELAAHLLGAALIARQAATDPTSEDTPLFEGADFADIVGQEHAKRALEVAAAGGHNLVMRGPPGSGKTLLARAIPSILPPMTNEEALEVTRIYSVAGLLPTGSGLISSRPFRAPHHTISNAGLVGGGSNPRPGEITLCNRGVLFLDELPEFGTQVLEVLRQPLEDRVVTISRARQSVTFPASFALVAAMNPCPCGFFGDPTRECTCPSGTVSRYQRRVSGPLLDRIDIFVEVPRVEYEKLLDSSKAEPSVTVGERVQRARLAQYRRAEMEDATASTLNAEMDAGQVREWVQGRLAPDARTLLSTAVQKLDLSARAFHRVLKVARTIADLDGADIVQAQHIAEAAQYRQRVE